MSKVKSSIDSAELLVRAEALNLKQYLNPNDQKPNVTIENFSFRSFVFVEH